MKKKIDRQIQQIIIQGSYKIIRKYERKEITTKADAVNKMVLLIEENVSKEEKENDN